MKVVLTQRPVMKKILPVILCASLMMCFSCKKPGGLTQSILEKYFNKNVIGRDFVVSLAKDSTTDLTAAYSGYIFVLEKTDFYHGPLKATKGSNQYEGTWSTNDDYSKLIITLPATVPEFEFLSRSWRFTKKDVPTLQLAPWGSNAPVVLHMTRQ
jgi:hypothetical protein